MITNMTVPISIGTAIAIQAICGFDPEGKPLVQGSVVRQYKNLFINVRTLARNFIGGQLPEVKSTLNERDIVYGVISDLRIINEILQKYTPTGIRVVPYLCTNKSIRKVFPNASFKEPKTDLQRQQANQENQVIDLIIKTQQLNNTNHVMVFDTKFNIPKQDDSLIITHLPTDLLNDHLFKKLVLLESHTGKLKTSIEWNTKLKNFKSEFQRIPFNDITVQLFGDTGDIFFPLLSPRFKSDLADIADKFQWNPTTSTQRMLNGVVLAKHKELTDLMKKVSITF